MASDTNFLICVETAQCNYAAAAMASSISRHNQAIPLDKN